MAQPPPYTRGYSFSDWTASNPSTPQPGVPLDGEFDDLATTMSALLENLALIQRDDGALANGIVGPDALSTELVLGLRTVSDWAPATGFMVNDAAWSGNILYRSLETHTSAAAFATDYDAGRWALVLDVTPYAQSAAEIAVTEEVLAGIELDVDLGPINVALASKAGLADTNAFTGANSHTQLLTLLAGFRAVVGSANTPADYWQARPTDYGAGKPGFALRKSATVGTWQLTLDDGAAGTGYVLDVLAPGGSLRVNGQAVWHAGTFDPTTKADASVVDPIQLTARRAKRYAFAL